MDATELQRLTVACRLMGKSVVDELQLIETEHRNTFMRENYAYSELREELIREATKKIDASLADEKAEVEKLLKAYTEAQKDVEDARVAESVKRGYLGEGKWKVGTKVQREVGPSYHLKTKYGVIEVYTRGTVLPENIASYNKPSIGGFFVRICTKDGPPGKRIETGLSNWKLAE